MGVGVGGGRVARPPNSTGAVGNWGGRVVQLKT